MCLRIFVSFSLLGSLGSFPSAFGQDNELIFEKWSGDVNVPDPVAVSLDNQGRAYVTQTQRRKSQDLDIRQNRDWIEDEVGFETIDDKRAFYHERLAPELSEQNKGRVADLNGDGSHDWRDLTVLSEKIHLLEDTDGDGTADQIQVYADNFQTEVTGIAAGVLWHEGEVFSTIAPDVWRLKDTDGDGKADSREIMATGFGMHIAYAGHDMHGLREGPDGKIYWTVGDKGLPGYPNQGGVMRCNPDGSDYEVFAYGLRNVQEIAFDEYGNLFGVDNDSDQPGEMERFVYIVKGSDAGWRCNYQYRGSGYNPWTAENLWKPADAENRPYYTIAPICNYKDGPCGFVYNPGTALGPGWERTFFMTEAPKGVQWAFQVEPAGASFAMVNSRKIAAGNALIGWNFGPDGAIYAADWANGYPLNQSGAVWRIDVADRDPRRAETQTLIAKDAKLFSDDELVTFLGHPDQRVRLKVQFEIVKRDKRGLLDAALSNSDQQLARIHAVWGLGQLARAGDAQAITTLTSQLADSDSEIQAQAAKAIGDLPPGTLSGEALIPLLAAESRRLQMHAAIALASQPTEEAVEPLVDVINRISAKNADEGYLVHAVSIGLAACAEPEQLAELYHHDFNLVHTTATLALRRQGSPLVADFLYALHGDTVDEAARAIHDDAGIPEALPALAETLDDPPHRGEVLIRRAINANLRLGKPEHAACVLKYALKTNPNEVLPEMRLHALETLAIWADPPVLDRVEGRRRVLSQRETEPIATAIQNVGLESLLAEENPALIEKTLELTKSLGIQLEPESLFTVLRNTKAPSSLRVVALENLATSEAIEVALQSESEALRTRGSQFLAKTKPDRAAEYLRLTLEDAPSVFERQDAIQTLTSLESDAADAVLKEWIGRFRKDGVEVAMHLELLDAAAARGIEASYPRDATDPLSAWMECLDGGDASAGKELFMTHIAAQCIRCHKVEDGKGSVIGPNLKAIGEKDERYLLEALVHPSAVIAKGYGMISVTLKDGTTVSGQLRKETDKRLEIRSADGKKTDKIDKANIATQTPPISLMPPMMALLSKRELRDVVAYMATLR
ncbi:MAG: PVC-type heme-binding CxxCH protein [Verrucomicrobiota bacterium]